MREKASELEAKPGMILAFRYLDATFITVKCLLKNSQDFFCSKQHFSINVPAVHNYKDIFKYAGCR